MRGSEVNRSSMSNVDTAACGMHPTNQKPQPLSTLRDLAEFMKCSNRHAARLLARGVIPSIRLGRLVRFDLNAVDAALRKRK